MYKIYDVPDDVLDIKIKVVDRYIVPLYNYFFPHCTFLLPLFLEAKVELENSVL